MIKLDVPYTPQPDYRTCFSTSVFMAVQYLSPGLVSHIQDYLHLINQIGGDTTEAWAQLEALKALNIKASFSNNCDDCTVKKQLDKKIPVPVGILHKGKGDAPTGGGHWITIVGYEDDATAPGGGSWIVHDPWGEIDHATGLYDNSPRQGAFERYSYALMDKRWTVDSDNDGWAILFKK